MTPTLGVIVLGCLAVVFVVGVVVGRLAVAKRQVDRILERELRFRADPQRAAAVRAKFMPLPSEPVNDAPIPCAPLDDPDAVRPPVYPAAPRTPAMPGLSTDEAMRGAEEFSAALSDAAQYGLPDQMLGRCAKPLQVSVGDARIQTVCLLRPGHDGPCS